MAGQEGSIAPKERVNIVYRPATGDAKEEVELPLKVLVLADFTHAEDDRALEDRKPININKDNFNDVLNAQNISLDMNVKNQLNEPKEGEEAGNIAVNLKINSIKDFEPDQIIKQVPELAKLLELREALKSLKNPLSNIPDFRKKIQALVSDPDQRAALMKELGISEE